MLTRLMSLNLFAHLKQQKRKLFMQLVVFPLSVPLFMVAVILLATLSIDQRTAQEADTDIGVEATIALVKPPSTAYRDAILIALPHHRVKVFSSLSLAQQAVDDAQATYVLDLSSYPVIELSLSKTRDYAHTHFVTSFKRELHAIVAQFQAIDNGFVATSSYDFNETTFGAAVASNTLFHILVGMMWMVLVFYASDVVRSYVYTLAFHDLNSDLLSHYRSLGINALAVIVSRWMAIGWLYALVSILFFAYVIAGVSLYALFVEKILSMLTQPIPPELYIATHGMLNFVNGITAMQLIQIWAVAYCVGMVILATHQTISTYATDPEHARSISKIKEFVLMMVPMFVYVIGLSPPAVMQYVIGINGYYVLLDIAQNNVPALLPFFATSLLWLTGCFILAHLRFYHWRRVIV